MHFAQRMPTSAADVPLHVPTAAVRIAQRQDAVVTLRYRIPQRLDGTLSFRSTAGRRRYILLGTSKIPNSYWVLLLKGTLNIDIKESISFGDAENDLAILKAAGFSVGMANSQKLVLDEVDLVTASNNEDGVALVVEKML